MSKFKIGDTLEVLTLPVVISDREKLGYKYFRFTVGKIRTENDISYYAMNDAHYGWRAKYLNKVEPD